MKIYVLTELSSGDGYNAERLGFDSQKVFTEKAKAAKELEKLYKKIQKYDGNYGEIVDEEYKAGNYYSIELEEEGGDTIYEAYIKEYEV